MIVAGAQRKCPLRGGRIAHHVQRQIAVTHRLPQVFRPSGRIDGAVGRRHAVLGFEKAFHCTGHDAL